MSVPAHVHVVDRMVRQLAARCADCGARAHFGNYEDPTHADRLLAAWLAQHRHGVTEPDPQEPP